MHALATRPVEQEPVTQIDDHRARRGVEGHPPAEWREMLARRGDRILGDERNVLLALQLAPELRDVLRFDEFRQVIQFGRVPPWRQVHLGDRWTDDDDLHLQAWLQRQGIDVRQRGVVADAVSVASKGWIVHPVREYLRSLTWDGEPRLQISMQEYFGADGDPRYLALVGRKFFIAAVARVVQPGCQVDHVLVLEARQGAGKSSAIGKLAEPWSTDGLGDLHSKDSAIHLSGVWIVELAELAALRRSETEAMKAFLTRRTDRYRPPFGRRAVDVPRQCVFVATTNEAQYLRDPTGNRRFWPVRCGEIDLAAIERDRDLLWAEAVHRFDAGEPWHPVGDEKSLAAAEQEDRVLVTELEQQVAEYLDKLAAAGIDEVTTSEVFSSALNIDPASEVERTVRLGRPVADAMQRAGWRKVTVRGRGKNRRTIYRKVGLIEIHRD